MKKVLSDTVLPVINNKKRKTLPNKDLKFRKNIKKCKNSEIKQFQTHTTEWVHLG